MLHWAAASSKIGFCRHQWQMIVVDFLGRQGVCSRRKASLMWMAVRAEDRVKDKRKTLMPGKHF